jgi:putative membrane protein
MARGSSSNGSVTRHVVAGLIGGLVASYAMEHFQQTLSWISREMGGASGGGGQQHRQPQSEPATYKAADAAAHAVTGRHLRRQDKPLGGSIVHYAFGGAVGAIYGAAASQNREITAWAGIPFGATVWLVADEIGVPLSGFSKAPTEYPLQSHVSALATHLVYGATTEGVRRLLMRPRFDREPTAVSPPR